MDGDLPMARLLAGEGRATVDLPSAANVTALYLSVALGREDAAEFLVKEAGADPNKLNGEVRENGIFFSETIACLLRCISSSSRKCNSSNSNSNKKKQ